MFGGKKPGKRGWGATGKITLSLVFTRETHKVFAFSIFSQAKATIMPYIVRYTQTGNLYYTDD